MASTPMEKSTWIRIGLPMAYHALGRKADSDAALKELIAKDAADSAYNIAYVYAYRGDPDAAFAWLEKSVEHRDSGLCDIAVNQLFTPLYDDPRWGAFLTRLGFAPAQLSAIRFDVAVPTPGATPLGPS